MDASSSDETLESKVSRFRPTGFNILCAAASATVSTLGGIALYEPTTVQEALTTYRYEIFGVAGALTVAGYLIGCYLYD